MPPILHPISASLSLEGKIKRTFVFFIRARLHTFNVHMFTIGSFLRIERGPDQLIRHASNAYLVRPALRVETNVPDQLTKPSSEATVTKLAPDTFESSLPSQLIRFSFVATLIRSTREAFKSELLDNQPKLIKLPNQTALITYDLAHNTRTVSKSYYDDQSY